VALAKQAVELLRGLHNMTGNRGLLFPGAWDVKKPLSENTLNAALRRLGYAQDVMTSHGFRAAASSMLNESGKWNADAIEVQLAHVEGNSVRRAYARAEFWEERVRMMEWWAAKLDQLRIGDRESFHQSNCEGIKRIPRHMFYSDYLPAWDSLSQSKMRRARHL
jgi:integrase